MTLTINEEVCIGCGVCMQICPDVFRLDEDEGKGTIIKHDVPDDETVCVKVAVDSCPVGCISG
jgi:ferredoxin